LLDISASIRSLAITFPWLTTPIIIATAVFIFGGPLAVLLVAIRNRQTRPAAVALCAVALSQAVVRIVGDHVWDRPRPFVVGHFTPLFPHSAGPSFPSGTVSIAAIAATVVWLSWRRLGAVLWAGVVVVAFGCVYVGVHYVSDVAAGAVLGTLCVAAVWFVSGRRPFASILDAIDRSLPWPPFPRPRAMAPGNLDAGVPPH
jgi:undecaprenyl-diphosphatase